MHNVLPSAQLYSPRLWTGSAQDVVKTSACLCLNMALTHTTHITTKAPVSKTADKALVFTTTTSFLCTSFAPLKAIFQSVIGHFVHIIHSPYSNYYNYI
jgi:hypothetical protein